jgi:formylglycine-generating enzyme required for sulfatase activity
MCPNCAVERGYSDTFGSGPNTFAIEFVTVGDPGNAADTAGSPVAAGSVPYTYRIGKYEISEEMIDKANALGGLSITKDGRAPQKPATNVNWNEAARFVNWLNVDQGFQPAYKFATQPGESGYSADANIELWQPSDAGYNPSNLYRNSLARYFLPTVDEWYKAAYFDPIRSVYYDFPTGSDTAPTAVPSGTVAGTVVYGQAPDASPADIVLVGGLSPYGTMGQGGNVWEWEETEFDLVNNAIQFPRGIRGGCWCSSAGELSSSSRSGEFPSSENNNQGIRVASVPEPATARLATAALLAIVTVYAAKWYAKNRGKKRVIGDGSFIGGRTGR